MAGREDRDLLRADLAPTSGRVRRGKTVQVATLSQDTHELDALGDVRVVEAVAQVLSDLRRSSVRGSEAPVIGVTTWGTKADHPVIAAIAAWKQRHVPGEAQVRALVERVSPMGWAEFSALLEDAYRRQGGTVTRVEGGADLLVERSRRLSVVAARRWKAASHGVEPLRELETLRESQGAHEALYVALGNVSDNARRFAKSHKIGLVEAMQLTTLLRLRKGAKAAS